tara:strand:- start:75 stop:539 length:465 start_codon:yes stop_codon:yes gene_type:complete
MPYLTIRDSDGAIIGENQGTPPADGDGKSYKLFADMLWDRTIVDGSDPTQFVDGAYSWAPLVALNNLAAPEAKWDSGDNTVKALSAGDKTTAQTTSRKATRDAIKAADKAALAATDTIVTLIAKGTITRADIDGTINTRVDAISDRDIDANPRG